LPVGNVMMQDFFEVWNSNVLNKYRKKHLANQRDISPCNKCNANGKVIGKKHAEVWHKKFEILNEL
jgi:hypothetical protein